MSASAKVNYTPEQSVELVAAYVANPTKETVEIFAAKFSKTAKSIIAKLSREGVYKKAEYVSKNGEKPIKKESVATEIGEFLGLAEGDTDSLAKANKRALAAISSLIAEVVNLREFKQIASETQPDPVQES